MRQVIIYIGLFIVFISGCESDNCFRKAGGETIERYNFDTIPYLRVNGVFDVELIPDSVYFIETIAPENLQSSLEFEVIGDSLVDCFNYNSCFWRRDYDKPKIKVHAPFIYEITLEESAYIHSTDTIRYNFKLIVTAGLAEADMTLNCDRVFFYINKTSGGRYNFSGKANHAFIMTYNTGLMDMSELIAKRGIIRNYSTVDMKVHVLESMSITIDGSGNILYRGNPNIIYETESTASGKPIPID